MRKRSAKERVAMRVRVRKLREQGLSWALITVRLGISGSWAKTLYDEAVAADD